MHFQRVVQLQSFSFQAPYGTYARTVKKILLWDHQQKTSVTLSRF